MTAATAVYLVSIFQESINDLVNACRYTFDAFKVIKYSEVIFL